MKKSIAVLEQGESAVTAQTDALSRTSAKPLCNGNIKYGDNELSQLKRLIVQESCMVHTMMVLQHPGNVGVCANGGQTQ